jgi:D-amino-acid dehydrogenase
MTEHIIIIGGGIIGLSTAYALQLARPASRVTILETGERAGHGASWANSAMIHPSQAWLWPECKSAGKAARAIAVDSYKLARRSSEILRAHFDDFDLEHRHRKSGIAKVYHDRPSMEAGLLRLEVLAAHGLRYDIWSNGQYREALGFDAQGESLFGAVHFPDDHSGPPRIYCARLVQAITDLGGVIKTQSEVIAIEAGRVTLTGGDVLQADNIVVCAGAPSAKLLGLAEVFGARGYSRTYHVKGLGLTLPPFPIMDDASHMSLTPLGEHLRVSGGADLGGHYQENGEQGGIFEALERFAFARAPHLKPALMTAPYSDWSAVRPMSHSGPIVRKVRDGIWAHTGHGHMGWTLCAGSAERFAQVFARG